MSRQANAYYDNGDPLNPGDSEKNIFAQIAAYLGRLAGISGNDSPPAGGSLPISPKQYSGVPTNFDPKTTDGDVFSLGAGEKGFIQNLDSADALAVKLGTGASNAHFSFILAPGAAQDDGKGGLVEIKDFVGVVSVATMTGTARYIAWKQAP